MPQFNKLKIAFSDATQEKSKTENTLLSSKRNSLINMGFYRSLLDANWGTANVVAVVPASNSLIYIIDQVLFPPAQ